MKNPAFPEFVRNLPRADLPLEELRGWLLRGESGQVLLLEVDQERSLPEHEHGDQWGIVIDGEMELTVAGRRVRFPVELSAGDRLVFKGMDDCRVYRRLGGEAEVVSPEGRVPRLAPGRNAVALALGEGAPEEFRLTVSLMKRYE